MGGMVCPINTGNLWQKNMLLLDFKGSGVNLKNPLVNFGVCVMKLNTIERMLLQRVLQEVQSDWETLKAKRVLVEQLSPSKAEEKKLNIRTEKRGDRDVTVWDVIPDRSFEISDSLNKKITNKLDELSKAEKLTDDWYSLMIKFFPKECVK